MVRYLNKANTGNDRRPLNVNADGRIDAPLSPALPFTRKPTMRTGAVGSSEATIPRATDRVVPSLRRLDLPHTIRASSKSCRLDCRTDNCLVNQNGQIIVPKLSEKEFACRKVSISCVSPSLI